MSVGTFTSTGLAHDPCDDLVHRCQGEPLRLDTVGDGGETDPITCGLVSARDIRRLRAAGLVSNRAGLRPDQLADVYGWTGTVDEFVTFYVETCVQGLDIRADERAGTPWHEQVRPDDDEPCETGTVGDLPPLVCEYLLRLVHAPKAEYAASYAYHVVHGAPCPPDPGAPWAFKARHRIDALVRKGVAA